MTVLLDPWPRRRAMIFDDAQWARLQALTKIVEWRGECSMPDDEVERHLPDCTAIVGHTHLDRARLDRAPNLRAVVNVESNFLPNIDYEACLARGVHVLSVAPAFAVPVAEWALGAALDLARGITESDRAFRAGTETYGLEGSEGFLLTGADLGLVGYGNVGRALRRLLVPFRAHVRVYDPWLPAGALAEDDCEKAELNEVLDLSEVIFLLAAVTSENQGFLGQAELQRIRPGAAVVLASRSGIVDFKALVELAGSGRFRAATDVFPDEPVPGGDSVRSVEGLLLSPHRAGAVPAAFHDIGERVLEDLELVLAGLPPVRCQPARRETVSRYRSRGGRTYERR